MLLTYIYNGVMDLSTWIATLLNMKKRKELLYIGSIVMLVLGLVP